MTRFKTLAFLLFALCVCFPAPSFAMANPASVYCADIGGKSIGVTNPDSGQSALCRLKDKSEAGEWTLFYQKAKPTEALTAFIASNPQSSDKETLCTSRGGKVKNLPETLQPVTMHSLCVFPDQSVIGLSTLALGPKAFPELSKLANQQ